MALLGFTNNKQMKTPCLPVDGQKRHFFENKINMKKALNDLVDSIRRWRLWALLGWLEIRQRYARSRIGPFWLTISMGVMISSIGLVYGTLFNQKLSDYLPYLAISLVTWSLFSSTIQEGSNCYINNSAYIKQVATPKFIYVLQASWRNILIFLHNIVIIVFLMCLFGVKRWDTLFLFIPGIVLVQLNATWIAAIAGLFSARYRDFPQIIASVMQLAFYITPVMYRPESLTRYQWLIDWNPLVYLIDIVRQPLLGEYPSLLSWSVAVIMAMVGWLLAIIMTNRCLPRITYWV